MKTYKPEHEESMFKGAPPSSFSKAEKLRERMTEAEKKLWEELKEKKFLGLKFRRQHPIQLYIVDFYCHKHKLIIEIDGEYHLKRDQRVKDEERTKALEEMNLKVIRFTNDEVLNKTEGVLKSIRLFIERNENDDS